MLELKNISLSVEDEFTGNGQKEILRDVSLTIETGKLVVVTGPNGGGKSTMAKMIAGILKPNRDRFFWMEKMLQIWTSHKERPAESALLSSSRFALRELQFVT